MPEQLDLLAHARALRDEGMARATTNADPDDVDRIDAAIKRWAASGREFSANTIRSELNVRGPVVGARFNAARMRRLITPVGYTPSTDPATHAHPVRTWRGVTPRADEETAA